MAADYQRIGIIGAGAWGTALANAMARAGRKVTMWALEEDVARTINEENTNSVYLPDVALDPAIDATTTLSEAAAADALLLVTPAQHLRKITQDLAAHLQQDVPVVICAKGIEQGSAKLMSEVVGETLPGRPVAVLSGPSFAIEVARERPTAVTIASEDAGLAQDLSDALGTPTFRLYQSHDIIGAQMGGAVKNVIAIACGVVEGLGLGDNPRAAMITRGLAEIARLAHAKGGAPETLMGLAGLGDLVLTCNAMQSRNFSLGAALGKGEALEDILGKRKSVAEGVFSAKSAVQLAEKLNTRATICHAVNSVINEGAELKDAIHELLARPVGEELDFQ